MSATNDVGDGDTCPIDRSHGHMFYLKSDAQLQYCAHTSHLGNPPSADGGATPPTRCFWPTGHISFAEAVRKYQTGER
jgi:hypothetical protein